METFNCFHDAWAFFVLMRHVFDIQSSVYHKTVHQKSTVAAPYLKVLNYDKAATYLLCRETRLDVKILNDSATV